MKRELNFIKVFRRSLKDSVTAVRSDAKRVSTILGLPNNKSVSTLLLGIPHRRSSPPTQNHPVAPHPDGDGDDDDHRRQLQRDGSRRTSVLDSASEPRVTAEFVSPSPSRSRLTIDDDDFDNNPSSSPSLFPSAEKDDILSLDCQQE